MLRVGTSFVLCLLSHLAHAADPVLSLDQALSIAQANNILVKNAELETDAVADEVKALRTRRYPQLDLRGSYSENLESQSYEFDRGVWGNYPVIGDVPGEDIEITSTDGGSGMLSADVIQPLSQQYEIGLSIEQGEVKQALANERVRTAQQDLASLVKQHYFTILRIQGDLGSLEQSILYYQSLDQLVSAYLSQKIALQYELLDVQARLARRQMEAVSQRNRLLTEKQNLNKLLARDLNTPFAVAEMPDPATMTVDVDSATATALRQRPDILGAKMHIKGAELAYDLQKAEYIPDVDLMLRYSQLYGHEFIPDKEAYVGLHAKWEIYDWGRKRQQLSSKNAQVMMAANHARQVEDKARIAVNKSVLSINEAAGYVEVARLSQAAARDKLRVLTNQYRQQSALLKDVLDAESELARANSEYNRAVLGVWQAQAEFSRAMGET